ncbi:hypothetical protein NQ318_005110 [Aromia moschata]|uniref:Ribosomal protein S19 n=1 Tax=Aromia moschata TaxID=1265417 RepID=A0AAV8XIS9_9CUCU|nr:hypothetical protein NQ318_005110 [Aromia moschata]
MNSYPAHKFLSGLDGLKRDVKQPKTIRATDGPQRQKRTNTLKILVNQSSKIVVKAFEGLLKIGIKKKIRFVRPYFGQTITKPKNCTPGMDRQRRIQLLRNALLIPQIKFLTWDFPSQTGLVEISTTKFVGHLT